MTQSQYDRVARISNIFVATSRAVFAFTGVIVGYIWAGTVGVIVACALSALFFFVDHYPKAWFSPLISTLAACALFYWWTDNLVLPALVAFINVAFGCWVLFIIRGNPSP